MFELDIVSLLLFFSALVERLPIIIMNVWLINALDPLIVASSIIGVVWSWTFSWFLGLALHGQRWCVLLNLWRFVLVTAVPLVLSGVDALVWSFLITFAELFSFRIRVGPGALRSLLHYESLDGTANLWKLHRIMIIEIIFSRNFLVFHYEVPCVFGDANFSWDAIALHLVGNEDTITKNVISYNLASDDACNDSSRVDTDPHIEVL